MPDTQPDTTDVDIPAPMIERPASTAIMTTDQFDSTWRMSKALAASGSFKDIGKEEGSKALARIMLGADLGMSPTQALMGIDIVKGNPQIRGVALGRMVRQSAKRPTPTGESYDYAVLDRGFEPDNEYAVVALYRRDEDGSWPHVEDEEGATFPTSIGSVTIAKGKKLPAFVEAFKLDQAKKRNLVKLDGAWQTQPEVMCVWRALSQIVRFEAPDVIGGMSVYTEADSFGPAPIGAGQGSGEGPGWGDMPTETVRSVMNVIERAREVKHAGLSDLPTIQQRLNGQPAEVVAQWVEDQMAVLDGMEPEPPDAEVVEDEPAPADAPSLTFGGQTFLIDPYKYPVIFTRISTTLDDGGADECEKMAIELLEVSENFSDELLIDQYRLMAEAMHMEAESRRDVNEGQTEIEF